MVVVVLTVCIDDVSVDIVKRVHPIRVAEHLGVRLPASPSPWHSTSRWTECEKCCISAAKMLPSNLHDIVNEVSEAHNADHCTTVPP